MRDLSRASSFISRIGETAVFLQRHLGARDPITGWPAVSWEGFDGFFPDHFECDHFACEDDNISVMTKVLSSREVDTPSGRVTEERLMFYLPDDVDVEHLDRLYYHGVIYEMEVEPIEHWQIGNIKYRNAVGVKVDSVLWNTTPAAPVPVDDPKYVIKDILDAITTTIDNNVTAASLLYIYEGGPEDLKYLFLDQDYDVVVTFADPEVRSTRDIQDVPLHYPTVVPVTVTSIDKSGVTATKMQNKMRVLIRARVEAFAQTAGYTLKILRESSDDRRKGGIDRVWETTYWVEYDNV